MQTCKTGLERLQVMLTWLILRLRQLIDSCLTTVSLFCDICIYSALTKRIAKIALAFCIVIFQSTAIRTRFIRAPCRYNCKQTIQTLIQLLTVTLFLQNYQHKLIFAFDSLLNKTPIISNVFLAFIPFYFVVSAADTILSTKTLKNRQTAKKYGKPFIEDKHTKKQHTLILPILKLHQTVMMQTCRQPENWRTKLCQSIWKINDIVVFS